MKKRYFVLVFLLLTVFVTSCDKDNGAAALVLETVFSGNLEIMISGAMTENVSTDLPIDLKFSAPIDENTVASALRINTNGIEVDYTFSLLGSDQIVRITPASNLLSNRVYTIDISNALKGKAGGAFPGRTFSFATKPGPLLLVNAVIDDKLLAENQYTLDVSWDPTISLEFTTSLDTTVFKREVFLTGPNAPFLEFAFSENLTTVEITLTQPLRPLTTYTFRMSDHVIGQGNEPFDGSMYQFATEVDPTPKFPVISDEELLTKIQEYTFRYFWDFGHPNSGLARERNTSGNTVTSGGSGFGIMAMIVGVERGFITRAEAIERWEKILDFLSTCDRFHGVWPHWIDGNTGTVRPFSERDNGGDLVETAFMIQGLLTLRQYLDPAIPAENSLINQINTLWEAVEWDWYTKGEGQALYWHWSPEYNFAINLRISGHNETQITYILAAGSPTHTIPKSVYDNGWARNGGIVNNQAYYGYALPVGQPLGGPLFFTHYSYLGLDPRQLEDAYANYWQQNTNHALINHAYCVDNPLNYPGYSEDSWGLTASDNNGGYSAHSPTNDRGVITPTAAVASLPYTPELSMQAIRHFYYVLGDRLWGEYGFYDAFNPSANWTASSYLAIDQGPIVCMIENYRTQLLWDLFMTAPEVRNGLDKLGFTYE